MTEKLTKCCEPLQKLRVRLGACKFGISPQVILYNVLLIVPKRYFCGGSYCFMSWCLFFVLLAPYICYHILVKVR